MNKARLVLDKDFQIAPIDRHIYSSFIENGIGIVPNGLYNPSHPEADELGFRKDVIQLIRDLHTPAIRYPGGNYISNYDWTDAIGPREKRPVRNNIVHGTIDHNEVGIDDFVDYSKRTGTEFMLTVNMGTAGIREIENEIEYCNVEKGTTWSDLRRKNGHEEPHRLQYWFVGNEMDGNWQVGHLTAQNYGLKAAEVSKVMKMVDPSVKLIVCGTAAEDVPTYLEWDRIVLEHTLPYADYLSIHKYYYYGRTLKNTFGEPHSIEDLAWLPLDLDRWLTAMEGTIQHVKTRLRSNRNVYLSVDEWGLNSSCDVVLPPDLKWTEKVHPINEDNIYPFGNLIDALIYGIFLIGFINHSQSVTLACRSLLRHTTMTTDPHGIALKHTTYYVMQLMARYGRGVSLRNQLSSPMTRTENHGDCPSLYTAASYDEESGEVAVFAVNLDLRQDIVLDTDLRGFESVQLMEHIRLFDEQPLAGNNFENPLRMLPQSIHLENEVVLRKHSWNLLRYRVR